MARAWWRCHSDFRSFFRSAAAVGLMLHTTLSNNSRRKGVRRDQRCFRSKNLTRMPFVICRYVKPRPVGEDVSTCCKRWVGDVCKKIKNRKKYDFIGLYAVIRKSVTDDCIRVKPLRLRMRLGREHLLVRIEVHLQGTSVWFLFEKDRQKR